MAENRTVSSRSSGTLVWLSSTGLVVMTAILCWQVFARYVLGASQSWTEQAALILMVWIVFLGSAAGIRDGFHIRIAEGVDRMSPALGRWAKRLANILVIGFGLLLAIWGSELVTETWGNQVPTLPFTRGMVYLIIPTSGLLMAWFAWEHMRRGEETGGSVGI